eukprot:1193905-Prorocentrum_minimum.AAC.1
MGLTNSSHGHLPRGQRIFENISYRLLAPSVGRRVGLLGGGSSGSRVDPHRGDNLRFWGGGVMGCDIPPPPPFKARRTNSLLLLLPSTSSYVAITVLLTAASLLPREWPGGRVRRAVVIGRPRWGGRRERGGGGGGGGRHALQEGAGGDVGVVRVEVQAKKQLPQERRSLVGTPNPVRHLAAGEAVGAEAAVERVGGLQEGGHELLHLGVVRGGGVGGAVVQPHRVA